MIGNHWPGIMSTWLVTSSACPAMLARKTPAYGDQERLHTSIRAAEVHTSFCSVCTKNMELYHSRKRVSNLFFEFYLKSSRASISNTQQLFFLLCGLSVRVLLKIVFPRYKLLWGKDIFVMNYYTSIWTDHLLAPTQQINKSTCRGYLWSHMKRILRCWERHNRLRRGASSRWGCCGQWPCSWLCWCTNNPAILRDVDRIIQLYLIFVSD